ncbi:MULTISPECIES: hypothetical protein [unclassified Streptomyces]
MTNKARNTTVDALPGDRQHEVRGARSGGTAVHRPSAPRGK